MIRVIPRIHDKYVIYLFQSNLYWSQISSRAQGTTRLNVNANILKQLLVPLPPLAEQQRIVEQIESLFAKLDEAKEKAEEVLDGFENRKLAILHDAFSGKLTNAWRDKNGVDRNTWKKHKFVDLCEIVRGGSPRPAGSPIFYDGDIPFMKVADITNNVGPYVYSTEHTIKEAGLKKTRKVEANTLLLTNSGATLGVPAITTMATTFNDGIAAFLGLNEESLMFYYYFWVSKTSELRTINKGAAQPNLNTKIIGDVEIEVPSIDEQKKITEILHDVLYKEQKIKDVAENVVEQIDLIKKSILAKAFRGELGTNNSEEEGSIELLKEIL